jgi:uncharacterized protein YbjT (DUF2867 family)
MATNDTVLVTGITGKQGGAVANCLLRHGTRVIGLTRNAGKAGDWKRRGVQLLEGDLTDRKFLDEALKLVERVYLVTTPFEGGMEAEVRQGTTLIDAAGAAGIRHLVFSSVVAADRDTGIPHFETKGRIEKHLRKSGVPYTVIRPVFFMENFLSPWMLPGILAGKVILGLRPDRKLQMIALRDIGEFVLAAFREPDRYRRETIEIAGDELTIPEALGVVSRVNGRPIGYEMLPDDRLEQAVGLDMALMFRWFNDVGYKVDIPALESRWDIVMTRFREFALETSWSKRDVKAA